MAGRFYTVSFDDISVSAAQDLLNLTATASMAFRLWRVQGGQRGLTSWNADRDRPAYSNSGVQSGAGAVPPSSTCGESA